MNNRRQIIRTLLAAVTGCCVALGSVGGNIPNGVPGVVYAAEAEITETETTETEAVETAAAETETVETEVMETEAAETEAVETEVTETEAAETEVAETEVTETEAADTEATETETAETEVTETEAVETEVIETEAVETEVMEAEAAETEEVMETEETETEETETEETETEVIEPEDENPVGKGSFVDVGADRYYYRPVQWALENDITTGTSPTTFSPEESCTRAQTVTFLWRMAGEPEPKSMKTGFTDVVKGSYYEKAVAWAVENGVTTGKDARTFDPNGICTRAEFVTFLYREAGFPKLRSSNTRFTDLESGRYYEKAVAWAVENGVTTGTSPTTFSPHETCTRGQVVTFLHRWRTTISVWDCGATPDDGTDDTGAINRAIERAAAESGVETVYVPAGTYVINAGTGINLKSNTSLLMDPGAVLDVAGNSLSNYSVLSLRNVQNVSISGGQIKGERYKHSGTRGEWGMGIGIYDSKNVSISKVSVSANWGDGIYLGTANYSDNLYGCDGIRIDQCNIFDNRRSNISIVDADNVTINGCTISNANGTAPQCGINIEPNADSSGRIPEDAVCKHIRITNTTVNVLGKDDYWGQFFCFMTINYPDNSVISARDIRISSCTFNGDSGNYSGADVTISDTVIRGTFYDEQNTNLQNVSYENIWRN